MQKYIDQLNEAQRAPVLKKDGPMIIIAGAGSGKTRVLTIRIAYLMHQGIDAFNIFPSGASLCNLLNSSTTPKPFGAVRASMIVCLPRWS